MSNLFRSFRHWLNLFRRYPYWKREKCIFIHTPKAAGTSINHALYGRTLGHYTYSEINSFFPGLVRQSFVFSITRNPYDRLVSAYHFAKMGRTAEMGMHKPEQYRIPEFDSFERFVTEWLSRQDLTRIDHVFRPQYLYVCHNGKIAVDFLGKVETLHNDIEKISQQLRRPIAIGKMNVVQRPSSFSDFYTPELAARVYQLYEMDFRLLGYPEALPTHPGNQP